MNAATIARRIADGDLHYALGRFETVRHIYSYVLGLMRPANTDAAASVETTLFPDLSATAVVDAVRRDSVAYGLTLPDNLVADLVRFAENAKCHDRTLPHRFRRADVVDGHLADGTPLVHGLIPSAKECATVQRIAEDPLLVRAAERFLGYRPRTMKPCLFWSFPGPVSDDERRRRGQTIDWHFDVYDFNGFLANFYLTDVDADAGPHALVRGSHTGKRLKMLLGSARTTDEAVLRQYGPDRITVIEGKAGTGFFEDAACYHRAIPPRSRERLLLQIWYS